MLAGKAKVARLNLPRRLCSNKNGTKYIRMDQVKSVEESL